MKADNIEFNKSETEINSSITEILSQPISDKEIETKLKDVQGNVIYYLYDEATNTLHIFGEQEEGTNEY